MEKISVLFDVYHLYHLPQFDPVIDLIKNDNRFELYLSVSNSISSAEYKTAVSIIEKRGHTLILGESPKDRQSKIRDLNLDWFICGWSRYSLEKFVQPSTMVGMIYHGIGVKPSYWKDNHSRLNVRFVEGPFRQKQLVKKGIQTKTELVGFPKLDPIINNTLPSKKELLKKMNLDPTKQTILYAPTFYPSSFELLWKELVQLHRYNIILKLHSWVYFLDKFSDANLTKQKKLAEKICKKYDHLYLATSTDYSIVPFLHISDVLITEASSTIYEMQALKKPVIICNFFKLKLSHRLRKNRLFKRRLDKEMVEEYTRFCYRMDKPNQSATIIKEALADGIVKSNPDYSKYIFDMLYETDGKASKRIMNSLLTHTLKR